MQLKTTFLLHPTITRKIALGIASIINFMLVVLLSRDLLSEVETLKGQMGQVQNIMTDYLGKLPPQ